MSSAADWFNHYRRILKGQDRPVSQAELDRILQDVQDRAVSPASAQPSTDATTASCPTSHPVQETFPEPGNGEHSPA
jgi:hypothetical protein